MAYTRALDDTRPNGALVSASQIDDEIRSARVDYHERLSALFENPDIDPPVIKAQTSLRIIAATGKLRLDGSLTGDSYIYESSANVVDHYAGGANTLRLSATGATITGTLNVSGTLTASLTGNVTGNLAGNVTGNVTGVVTGSLIGNASTATALANVRTIWGQNFDGTGNVSGALSNVTTITATSDIFTGAATELGWTGRATMKSPSDGIITLYNDALSSFTRLQFGGTTNSFPAIKRNGASLDVVLANDGGYTGLVASSLSAAGGGAYIEHIGVSNNALAVISASTSASYEAMYVYSSDTSYDNRFISFYATGLKGYIDYNRGGGVVRFATSSDRNLKTVYGNAPRSVSLSILRKTQLREYSWNDDKTQKRQIGLIAQEAQEYYSGAVSEGGEFTNEDGEKRYIPWGIDKTAWSFHIIAGWQDHDERIKAIEKHVGIT